jgi:hypothetical protein
MTDHVRKILYVTPQRPATLVLDALTRRSVAMLRAASGPYGGRVFRGYHRCQCGAKSGNFDLSVSWSGETYVINHLAAHYVAYHRDDVDPGTLEIVASYPDIVTLELIRDEELQIPEMPVTTPRFLRGARSR